RTAQKKRHPCGSQGIYADSRRTLGRAVPRLQRVTRECSASRVTQQTRDLRQSHQIVTAILPGENAYRLSQLVMTVFVHESAIQSARIAGERKGPLEGLHASHGKARMTSSRKRSATLPRWICLDSGC